MTLNGTAVQNLFDGSGRRIAPAGLNAAVNQASDRYSLLQPSIDYAEIHARITEHVGIANPISATEFAERAEGLLDTIRRDDGTGQITSGVRVPFLLGVDGRDDLGQALDDAYLPALARSWKARFPKYEFRNELKGRLAGKVGIAAGSGYERLVKAMAHAPVVGYYFPQSLSGFSVNAGLRQMSDLPDSFVLSGGHEACAALVGCPDLMVKADGYPPQLDLAALLGPAPGYGYHFAPYGSNLTFNGRFHNGQASDYCSAGLTAIAFPRKKK